jgi:hypothetical protein
VVVVDECPLGDPEVPMIAVVVVEGQQGHADSELLQDLDHGPRKG